MPVKIFAGQLNCVLISPWKNLIAKSEACDLTAHTISQSVRCSTVRRRYSLRLKFVGSGPAISIEKVWYRPSIGCMPAALNLRQGTATWKEWQELTYARASQCAVGHQTWLATTFIVELACQCAGSSCIVCKTSSFFRAFGPTRGPFQVRRINCPLMIKKILARWRTLISALVRVKKVKNLLTP